jgi:ABC-2 type transport system ATP-binding protein
MNDKNNNLAIEIQNLTKSYITPSRLILPSPRESFSFKKRVVKEVLKNINLKIKKGEVYGFIGPNGAGKTTLIKCILNLAKIDSGRILIFDSHNNPISSKEYRSRDYIGYLPERPYYQDFLTASEFLLAHGRLYGMSDEEVKNKIPNLLKTVGLKNYEEEKLSTFSKGMLQRIGIAQALLKNPEILILDEPMSGLDPVGRREVRDLIVEIAKLGKTIFFSTHIIHDVEVICTNVAYIYKGELKGEGRIEELLGKTVKSSEIRFRLSDDIKDISQNKILKNSKKTLDGWVIEVESHENRLEYDVQEVLQEILRLKGFVLSVVPRKSTLEDFFITHGEVVSGGHVQV